MLLYSTLFASFTIVVAVVVDAASSSSSAPDNVSSRLMVHIPHSLYKENGYDHREALFGKPAYGGSIAQNVYYAQQELCDGDVDTTIGVPTRPIDPDTNKMQAWPSPFILMVDRGGCTFVKKVRNAQRAGAAGVIIADNTCLCSDAACITQTKLTVCEQQEPIMADDGSGADISVPSYLMFKHDADIIKAELIANRPVQIEMSWNLPSPDDRVEYDLWTTPSDVVSRDFLRSFKVIAEALGDHAYFTPHMYIYDGIRSQCQGNNGQNYCANLCTNNGRYCSTDPDNDLDKGVSGADVVRESLRRLCIWSTYGATNGIGAEWWDYVATFNERCAANPAYFADQKCIQDVYKVTKIDGKGIEQCMVDSGDTTADRTNAKLDTELTAQSQRGVVVIPTAFVNTAAIRGALNVNNIFTAICSGYVDGSTPEACMRCAGCPDPITCVKNGICSVNNNKQKSSGGGISASFFMMSMLTVVGFFTALGVWHYKRTREDMREQVRGILAEYMPLEDNEDGRMNGKIGSPMDFAHGGGVTTSLIS